MSLPPRSPVNGLEALRCSLEEVEARMETACIEVDFCFGSFCWQFASQYACTQECTVFCHPFMGCDPYCYE